MARLMARIIFVASVHLCVVQAQQPSPCTDGSRPACPGGATPVGQPPSCTSGTLTCADGSSPSRPGGNQQNGNQQNAGGGGGVARAPSSSSVHAAAMLGDVALTTATGTNARTGTHFNVGENIYGPFEAGFGSAQSTILMSLGCSTGSLGYVAGGIDVYTAEQMVASQCSIVLPRVTGAGSTGFVSLIDECGGHTREYHFHERMSCLYDGTSGAHSPRIGQTVGGQSLYGKWEHTTQAELPLLDACGGHFGFTPESPSSPIYHYHVQVSPPFTLGCIGPNDDNTLVTVEQCRAFYTGCNGNLVTVTTPQGSKQYDDWCPCYDANGLNTGINIVQLPVFATNRSEQTAESKSTPKPKVQTASPAHNSCRPLSLLLFVLVACAGITL